MNKRPDFERGAAAVKVRLWVCTAAQLLVGYRTLADSCGQIVIEVVDSTLPSLDERSQWQQRSQRATRLLDHGQVPRVLEPA
jgi:hypothetical protein